MNETFMQECVKLAVSVSQLTQIVKAMTERIAALEERLSHSEANQVVDWAKLH